MIALRPIASSDLPVTVEWRNHPVTRPGLRTSVPATLQSQEAWFARVSQADDPDKYWIVSDPGRSHIRVGLVGLTGIQDGSAEVSLLIDPRMTRHGYGRAAFMALIAMGFEAFGLHTAYGECYHCNQALGFWQRMIADYGGISTTLPRRKFWNGQLHDSLYFTFTVDAWRAKA